MTRKQICRKALRVRIRTLKSTFLERFWKRVNKDGPIPAHMPHLGKCWVWTGTLNQSGYGQVKKQGEAPMCHRLTFEWSNGKIPKAHQVLHKCDNPPCVNPEHLFTGTVADNVRDCVAKGRRRYRQGDNHHNTKLTDEQVREIKTKWPPLSVRGTGAKMAAFYGVHKDHIRNIIAGVRRRAAA